MEAAHIRPLHYGGSENPREAIKVIEEYRMTFNIGQVQKYIVRHTDDTRTKEQVIDDLRKADFYLEREIGLLESGYYNDFFTPNGD